MKYQIKILDSSGSNMVAHESASTVKDVLERATNVFLDYADYDRNALSWPNISIQIERGES